MADEPKEFATWLPVIGRSLAYLCLAKAMEADGTEKYKSILGKVKFLEGLGLPHKDAAEAAGSTAESVPSSKVQQNESEKWPS